MLSPMGCFLFFSQNLLLFLEYPNKVIYAFAGRVLKVDLKLPGGPQSPSTASSTLRPTPPQASPSSGSASKLYSDQISSGGGGHRTVAAGRQLGSTTYSVR